MKTTDFITPTSSLILSVLNIANMIESCYGQYLIHPQAGYYLPHSLFFQLLYLFVFVSNFHF